MSSSPARIGAVSLGCHRNGAALTRNAQAVHHRRHVGGLLFDGNGSDQPLERPRQKAKGENVLGAHKVDGHFKGRRHEKLIKGGLMVHEDQKLTPLLSLEARKLHVIPQARNQRGPRAKQELDHPMSRKHPLFLFLHM